MTAVAAPHGLCAALDAIGAGKLVVLVDADHDRADLVGAAGLMTARNVTTMVRHGRGQPAVALSAERFAELGLRPVTSAEPVREVALCVVEARRGVTTGISSADRARTMRVLGDAACRAGDIVHPGHVGVLRARPGDLLAGRRRADAAVSLCRLAGQRPAAAVCEILDEDGGLGDAGCGAATAGRLSLRCVLVADLIDAVQELSSVDW